MAAFAAAASSASIRSCELVPAAIGPLQTSPSLAEAPASSRSAIAAASVGSWPAAIAVSTSARRTVASQESPPSSASQVARSSGPFGPDSKTPIEPSRSSAMKPGSTEEPPDGCVSSSASTSGTARHPCPGGMAAWDCSGQARSSPTGSGPSMPEGSGATAVRCRGTPPSRWVSACRRRAWRTCSGATPGRRNMRQIVADEGTIARRTPARSASSQASRASAARRRRSRIRTVPPPVSATIESQDPSPALRTTAKIEGSRAVRRRREEVLV